MKELKNIFRPIICFLFIALITSTALLAKPKSIKDEIIMEEKASMAVTHLIKGAKLFGHQFSEQQLEDFAKAGIKISKADNSDSLSIDQGNVLFSPDKNMILKTPQSSIYVADGATVFLIVDNNGLVIYDLVQSRPNQVILTTKKHRIYMHPGYVLALSEQNVSQFEKLNLDCHAVTHGPAQKLPLSEKELEAFVAGFSISSAFLFVQPLKILSMSTNKQDKLVFEKILKGAATLDNFLGPIQPAQLANMSREL